MSSTLGLGLAVAALLPPKQNGDPSLCNPQFCSYDVVHKDYIYTQACVDFLVAKLSDEATYQVVMTGVQ